MDANDRFLRRRRFEPEVEFEIVEPRDVGIDALLAQFVGKVFIMVPQEFGVGRIVKGDDKGVVSDPNVAFQTFEEIARQVRGVPIDHRWAEALAQLMNGGLSQQGHRQLAVTDI